MYMDICFFRNIHKITMFEIVIANQGRILCENNGCTKVLLTVTDRLMKVMIMDYMGNEIPQPIIPNNNSI